MSEEVEGWDAHTGAAGVAMTGGGDAMTGYDGGSGGYGDVAATVGVDGRDSGSSSGYDDSLTAAALASDEDALQFTRVTQVTDLLRSSYLSSMFRKLSEYEDSVGGKNAITPDDPEYAYVADCSTLVLRIEAAISRVHVFLRAHYATRFGELAVFFTDAVVYGKVVQLLGNDLNFTADGVLDALVALAPSQLLAVVMACASTTRGRALTADELARVREACQEMANLEMAKQTFLEYIQSAMPLVCPNLCAFLGTALTSQLFALAGGVDKLALLDAADVAVLGSRRANTSGVALRTAGFLSNADMVCNMPPQLRPKALRLVAGVTVTLARIDAHRRASAKDEGVRERLFVCNKLRYWLDPPVVRGAGHNFYERRGRKRLRTRG